MSEKIYQRFIDECESMMSNAEHRKKIAEMDHHKSEIQHQEGRWHCALDLQKWAESELSSLPTPQQPFAPTDKEAEIIAEQLYSRIISGGEGAMNQTGAECVFTPLESLLRLADVSPNYTGKETDFKNVERAITAPNPQPASAALGYSDATRPFDKYNEGESSEGDVLISGWIAASDVQTIRQALVQCVWQPIETAPRDGTRIIINTSNTMFHNFAEASWTQGPRYEMGWVAHDNEGTYIARDPTHWMPLPAAPVAGKGEV